VRLIRFVFVGGVIIAFVASIVVYFLMAPKGSDPLFFGPPQFVVLAILVAFGAYLRQLSLASADLRDKIRCGEVWNFPPTEEYAKAKMQQCDRVCDVIRFVTPFMILLLVAVSFRIVVEAILRIYYGKGQNPAFLYSVDLMVALCLFLGFLGLAIAHFKTRSEDEYIRREARAQEESTLKQWANKKREGITDLAAKIDHG
jgi:hypothetical protein